jgi:hypothetical protein
MASYVRRREMISGVNANVLGAYSAPPAKVTDSQASAVSSKQQATDTVEISQSSRLLGKAVFKLPNWESVKEFKREFSVKLRDILQEAGIDRDPPLNITQNMNTGVFSVTGDNPRAAEVQDILNGNDELKTLHHSMQAIASHIPAMEEGLKFQAEYRAAQGAAAVQSVVAKYSSLFSGMQPQHSFTTQYGPNGAMLYMDGKSVA